MSLYRLLPGLKWERRGRALARGGPAGLAKSELRARARRPFYRLAGKLARKLIP